MAAKVALVRAIGKAANNVAARKNMEHKAALEAKNASTMEGKRAKVVETIEHANAVRQWRMVEAAARYAQDKLDYLVSQSQLDEDSAAKVVVLIFACRSLGVSGLQPFEDLMKETYGTWAPDPENPKNKEVEAIAKLRSYVVGSNITEKMIETYLETIYEVSISGGDPSPARTVPSSSSAAPPSVEELERQLDKM